jgi:hypothetical protein
MSLYLVKPTVTSRVASAVLAVIAIVLSPAAIAQAEECLNVATNSAAPDFTLCDTDDQPALDTSLPATVWQPAPKVAKAKKQDGVPWIIQSSKEVPLAVTTTGSGVSLKTSLDSWRDYSVRAAALRFDQSDAAAKPSLKLPNAPALQKSPLNVWSSVNVQGYEGDRDQSTRAGVGADYKLSHAATVGVAVERGDASSAAGVGDRQDSKASAYVTLQAAPMLSLDARTEWQAGNAEFAEAAGAAENSSFSLAPKINHKFTLGDGKTLEPFVTYKREFDLTSAGREAMDASVPVQSAGAGVTFTKSDSYSLSVTTDLNGLGVPEDESLSSKFRLSVPIK